jgi:hypothetical protein
LPRVCFSTHKTAEHKMIAIAMEGLAVLTKRRCQIWLRTPCKKHSSKLTFLIRIVEGGVHTGSTRHVGHFWPTVPAPGDCEDGEFGGIKIGRGNRSTRRKPASTPFCPPQIPLDQTRARTQVAAVGSQRLTA